MEKHKISRRDYAQDYTINNIKFKTSGLSSLSRSEKSDQQRSSIQEKKTQKIIKQPRKRPVMVNFHKQNTMFNQLDLAQAYNDTSAQPLKPKTTRKEIQIQRTKSLNEEVNLKNIFSNYRLANLKKHMFNQLRKNSVFRSPVVFEPFSENINEDDMWKGIELPRLLLNLTFIIGIAQTFLACFLITMLFAFQDKFFDLQFFRNFHIFSLLWLFCEIVMGFLRVKQVGSRKLTNVREITSNYLRYNFIIDLLCFFSILLCLVISNYQVNYLLVLFFLKTPDCIEKLVKIETKLFQSFYWEQYWGLMKILLSNFLYAHFIAILILMMSWLDDHQSWLNIKNIVYAPWYEQYSWAYYWGTTVMLTVGFGDLAAANYKEAICLVLIETVSCMALAYNINCIGNLLKDLRAKQLQKQKSLKVLKKLCQKNQINQDLDFKLSNHVKESYNIQTKYNFEQESQFIQKLPVNLRQDFLRTANQKVLSNLTFIRNFTNRTIQALAQKIQLKIAHPDQILCGVNEVSKIIILKQGEIGLFPNHSNEKYSKIAIDKFQVKQNSPSILISLEFLQLPIVRKYDTKSIVYSQVHVMETQSLLQILKRKDVDIQFFQSMRDKQKIVLDNFQIVKCNNCDSNHTKFRCPRLHYMPIAQQIIFRHIHSIKVSKNVRFQFARSKVKLCSLKEFKKNQEFLSNQKFKVEDSEIIFMPDDDFILLDEGNRPSIRRGIGRLSSNAMNQFQGFSDKQKKSFISRSSHKELKSKRLLSAAEIVQKEMKEFFNERQKQFWSVEIDEAKDYKFYFCKHNPKCLESLMMKKNISMVKSKSVSNSKPKGTWRKNT